MFEVLGLSPETDFSVALFRATRCLSFLLHPISLVLGRISFCLLIVDVEGCFPLCDTRRHTHTHTHIHTFWVGFLWTKDGPVAETSA